MPARTPEKHQTQADQTNAAKSLPDTLADVSSLRTSDALMPQNCGTSIEVIGAQGDPERKARAVSREHVARYDPNARTRAPEKVIELDAF